jgi:hypothetical protein
MPVCSNLDESCDDCAVSEYHGTEVSKSVVAATNRDLEQMTRKKKWWFYIGDFFSLQKALFYAFSYRLYEQYSSFEVLSPDARKYKEWLGPGFPTNE